MPVRTTCLLLASGVLLAACGAQGGGSGGVATNPPGQPATTTATASPSASPVALADLHSAAPPVGLVGVNTGWDPVSRRVILHGGMRPPDGGGYVSQTWAWDGRAWTRLSPHTELPPQAHGAMAVDPVSGHLMFMGGDAFDEGTDSQGNNVPQWSPNLGTWLWDGAAWARVADNPRQGGDPALAVDQATGQLVVRSPDIRGVVTSDDLEASGPAWYGSGTYRWTGSKWQEMPRGDAHILLGAGMAWDPISRRLIESGGCGQNCTPYTVAYDGRQWTEVHTATATGLGSATAANDPASGEILLLTVSPDHQNLCATWTWDGGNWVRHVVDEPPSTLLNGANAHMLWDPAIGRIVLVGAPRTGTAVQVWAWDGVGSGWELVPA